MNFEAWIDEHYQIHWSDMLAIKHPCHVPSLTRNISGVSGESSSRVEQEILVRVRGQHRDINWADRHPTSVILTSGPQICPGPRWIKFLPREYRLLQLSPGCFGLSQRSDRWMLELSDDGEQICKQCLGRWNALWGDAFTDNGIIRNIFVAKNNW